MRYRLRTLLILLAVGPPLLAGAWLVCDYLSRPPEPDVLHFVIGGRIEVQCTFGERPQKASPDEN